MDAHVSIARSGWKSMRNVNIARDAGVRSLEDNLSMPMQNIIVVNNAGIDVIANRLLHLRLITTIALPLHRRIYVSLRCLILNGT